MSKLTRLTFKISLASIVLLALFAGVGAPSANAGNGATKVDLLSTAFGSCNSGASGGTVNRSFAVINFPGNDTVSATVSVKNGPPNATLGVSLVQTPSGENCFVTEAVLTTNAQGNGTVHLSEPLLPGTTGAFVIIDGGDYATEGVAKN